MRVQIDQQKQQQAQQIADTTREIIMSVSSDEEKQLKKSLENIVDQLNELGLPYTLLTIVPYELERSSIGSLQYNNFSGLLLNAKTEEEKQEVASLFRYCDFMMMEHTIRYFANILKPESKLPEIFANFTYKVFHYFGYAEAGGLNKDKGSVIRYFKSLIKRKVAKNSA